MDVLGEIALAIVGTVLVLLCLAAAAWAGYEKYWSTHARRRRAAARRPTVAELIAKYRDTDA